MARGKDERFLPAGGDAAGATSALEGSAALPSEVSLPDSAVGGGGVGAGEGGILPPQAGNQRGGGRSQAQKTYQGPGGEARDRNHADQDDGRQADPQRSGRLQPVVGRLLGQDPASDPASRSHVADEAGDHESEPQEGHQRQSDHRHRKYERHRCDQKKCQKSRKPRGQGLPAECVGTGPHRPVEHQVDEQAQEHENGHEGPHPGEIGYDRPSPEQSSSEPGSGVRDLVPQRKGTDRDLISSRGEPGRHRQSTAHSHQVSANHGFGLNFACSGYHYNVPADAGGAGKGRRSGNHYQILLYFTLDPSGARKNDYALDSLAGREGVASSDLNDVTADVDVQVYVHIDIYLNRWIGCRWRCGLLTRSASGDQPQRDSQYCQYVPIRLHCWTLPSQSMLLSVSQSSAKNTHIPLTHRTR